MPRTCWWARRGPGSTGTSAPLPASPEVASADAAAFLQMSLPVPGASPFSGMVAEASSFGGEGVAINRVKIDAGRIFDAADPRAVMINQQLADRAHVRPGGTLHLIGYPQRNGNPDVAHEVRLAFRVSAIVTFADEIVPVAGELGEPRVLLSPAFSRTPRAQSFNPAGGGAYVVLRPGADAVAFTGKAATLARRYRVGSVQVVHLATAYAATQRAIRPEAAALAIFAALAGLIALAIIGQLLSRQLVLDSAEFPVLRALGMGRSALAVLSLARVAIVTTAGAAVAVAVAVAASPLMPIGPHGSPSPAPEQRSTSPFWAPGSPSSPSRRCWRWHLRRCGRRRGARSGWPSLPLPCAPPGWGRRSAGRLRSRQPGGADGFPARSRANNGSRA